MDNDKLEQMLKDYKKDVLRIGMQYIAAIVVSCVFVSIIGGVLQLTPVATGTLAIISALFIQFAWTVPRIRDVNNEHNKKIANYIMEKFKERK